MMLRAIRVLSTLSITAGMALLVVSCTLPLQRQHDFARHANQYVPLQKITQLNFGRDASFAVYMEPACPAVTRKTLPVTPPAAVHSAARTVAPGIDTTATLDPGEVLLAAGHRAPDAIATPAEVLRVPAVVHFGSGSAALSDAARTTLDQAAAAARATDRIVIAGRTDNVGSNDINRVLALARARAVRNYLRTRLPSHSHVFTLDAQGACCFTASNDTPEGRRQNRRVEIVFSASEQVAP